MAFIPLCTHKVRRLLRRVLGRKRELSAAGAILTAGLTANACGARPPAHAPPPATGEVVWSYEVTIRNDYDLVIDATFRGPASRLVLEPAVEESMDVPVVWDGVRSRPSSWRDPNLPALCRRTCRIRYKFRLKQAAYASDDVDTAFSAPDNSYGSGFYAPPSTWLVHPDSYPPGSRYRFTVREPNNIPFATGVRRAGAGPMTFEASIDSFEESSFAAFGPLRVRPLAGPDSKLVIGPGLRVSEEATLEWAKTALGAVTHLFGHPPSDSLAIFVVPGTSDVMRGKTLGGGGASVLIRVGTAITEDELKDDWVLCHELIHVGFPSIERNHAWFTEGLASYVEPVIRARAGLISKEKFWADLVEGLPRGLPHAGDKGLVDNDDIGRIYWGGSLYFLLADLAIHERTSGRRGLLDAVRAMANGRTVETFVPLLELLETGDRATGTRVLHELYDRLGRAAGTEDLGALWKRLGVAGEGATVTFDNRAPSATVREALVAKSSP